MTGAADVSACVMGEENTVNVGECVPHRPSAAENGKCVKCHDAAAVGVKYESLRQKLGTYSNGVD